LWYFSEEGVVMLLFCLSRNESSDSVGGGKVSPHTMEETLGSALNPNRAEMPGSKRKGSYDHVSEQ
jgi:hypothetical protein